MYPQESQMNAKVKKETLQNMRQLALVLKGITNLKESIQNWNVLPQW